MSEKDLRAGDFVTQGVRLLRPLAEGGMGRVWIAEHLGLRTEVVVKLMAREMTAREDGAARFAREAEVAAAIKSQHVVQVFDHGATNGVPYIVMELLEGKDLGAVLGERGRLEPSEAVAVVTQVGKALAKAHKAGIIHRDVKPENIFLCAGEGEAIHVKLLDFGTAKHARATGKETLPGEIMGTPYYMSPEQSVGALVDPRTDVWSLGVVAFEMLTGTKPFEGSNVGAIALAIHGPLPRIADRCSDLPPALDAWFARACAQVPQDRFASVGEMTSAFVEALTGQAPATEQTESICLVPPRRISVRPQDHDSEEMKKTMPTSIEPSVPPPPKHDSIPALVASLPDREAVHRPTKIAAGIVAVAAAALMAAIVMHR
ncbi:MAG: serine/threonine protein kinase, partial [Labilithrix sp.]|nr:serine/threonine protein kinase [Labilithrix sp.]